MKNYRGTLFILTCVCLGIFAEVCLMEGQIGISYTIFMVAFYGVFFFKYRKSVFTHKQFSLLLMLSIWVLTFVFAIYSNFLFYTINVILVPFLVFLHTILVTSPVDVKWDSGAFIELLGRKIRQTFVSGKISAIVIGRKMKRNMDDTTYKTGKKIGIGILISIPLLFIVIFLLSAADEQFSNIISAIPDTIFSFQLGYIWRMVKIIVITVSFYCYLKVVGKKVKFSSGPVKERERNWDTIIITTILLFINAVYLLFTIIQFQYFFSGTLEQGYSYAQYARKGFFELVVVTMINYGILLGTVLFIKKKESRFIQVLLTLLISFSAVMLASAFIRLMMYEQAYGFTYLRVLAHSFMIFLVIVFVITLLKVWVNRLSLVRFFIILSLLYYVTLNVMNMDSFIVQNNIERYHHLGKIDVAYLGTLSYSAIPPLVELYKENPNVPYLKNLLTEKNMQLSLEKATWQSYNISREMAKEALEEISVK